MKWRRHWAVGKARYRLNFGSIEHEREDILQQKQYSLEEAQRVKPH